MIAGLSWGFDDRSRLTLALFADRAVSLDELDRRFEGGQSEVNRAYTVAGSFVRDLVHRHGPEVHRADPRRRRPRPPVRGGFPRAPPATRSPRPRVVLGPPDVLVPLGARCSPAPSPSGCSSPCSPSGRCSHRRARDAALRRIWEEEDERQRLAEAERLAEPGPGEWIH